MKQSIILNGGKKIETHAETAKLLIEMGRAIDANEAYEAANAKIDSDAEQRQKKVVEPEKKKHWSDLSPELEKIANNPPKRKYTRRK